MLMMRRRPPPTEPLEKISEHAVFWVLHLARQARQLDDADLVEQWNQANQCPEVTAWYHAVSGEMTHRFPEFFGGLRRGGRLRVSEDFATYPG